MLLETVNILSDDETMAAEALARLGLGLTDAGDPWLRDRLIPGV